jgi:hypothetical protein
MTRGWRGGEQGATRAKEVMRDKHLSGCVFFFTRYNTFSVNRWPPASLGLVFHSSSARTEDAPADRFFFTGRTEARRPSSSSTTGCHHQDRLRWNSLRCHRWSTWRSRRSRHSRATTCAGRLFPLRWAASPLNKMGILTLDQPPSTAVWPHGEALRHLMRPLVKKILGVLPHSSSVGGR